MLANVLFDLAAVVGMLVCVGVMWAVWVVRG